MTYGDTVQKAVDYIEGHIKEDISLYDISQHVNFSVPHLHRIFRMIAGETVKSYITRRKLTCAACELRAGGRNIMEIACEYGFESHDVFTRAFSRYYNMSPSKYRRANAGNVSGKLLVGTDKNTFERSLGMKYKVVNKNRTVVIGMECHAKQWDADGAIGRLWSDFLANVDKVGKPAVPHVMYGICVCESFDENDTFVYMAGIEAEEACPVPEGMVKRTLKQQKYIQAEVPEDVATSDAYTGTFEYIKQNGFSMDHNDEIEVYEEIFKDPDCNAFKLLIPIK